MITAETDYRRILQRELETRCQRIARYSLRAFARDLKLAPSRLSEVLSGKQGLSRAAASGVAQCLGLNERESEVFCDLVESQHARGKFQRELAQARLEKHRLEAQYQLLRLDAFQAISDWYHLPLLALLGLPNAKGDVSWLAGALDISQAEVSAALERLRRMGLIREEGGGYAVVHENVATPDGVPSDAIRNLHRSILERAIRAQETQPLTERNFSLMFLRVDRGRVEDAKRWIKNFRRKFNKRMGQYGNEDSVYCLAIQFFNMTRIEETGAKR